MEYLYSRNLVNWKYDLNADYVSNIITFQLGNCEIQMLNEECKIIFIDRQLTSEEINILNTIIENSRFKEIVNKSAIEMMDEIFATANTLDGPPTQQQRLMNVFHNTRSGFLILVQRAVKSGNYNFLELEIDRAYQEGDITIEDKNLILGILSE